MDRIDFDGGSKRHQFESKRLGSKRLWIETTEQVCYHDIIECHWPDQPAADFLTVFSDGSACVASLDGLASLTLLPHRQAFLVRFLAEVKHPLPQKTNNKGLEVQQKHYYTWQEQIHSLFSFPEHWKYPLQFVVDAIEHNAEKSSGPTLGNNSATKLPSSLPITCKAVHLHSWKAQKLPSEGFSEDWEIFWHQNMKVIWKNGITYRIFRQPTGLFTVEVDPGDGSLMRSQSTRRRYFNHWLVQQHSQQGAEIQERVYSTDRPLPDRLLRTEYSVGKLIKQATSYIEFLTAAGNQLEERCCWKEESNPAIILHKPFCPAHVVETADVTGTGRFKAYSDGNINIIFNDRTILDLRNLTKFGDKESVHGNSSVCQLVLPNGEVQQFSLADEEQCALYQQYLQTAQHWKKWLEASPTQRETFYKDTIWNAEKRGAIRLEIDKIQRFNYISHHLSFANGTLKTTKDTANSSKELERNETFHDLLGTTEREAMIKSVIDQNNKAVDDIDGLLVSINCLPQTFQ